MVVAVVMVTEGRFAAEALAEGEETHGDDHETRDDAHPGVEALGDDVVGGEESNHAEGEDAGGVGNRHGQTEEDGVAGGTAGTDEVGADDRFAVPRREGVQGAPSGSEEEGDGDTGPGEVVTVQERGETGAGAAAVGAGG